MMTDEELDAWRIAGTTVRIVRDALEENDVIGLVVAWDDKDVLIRKPNRRVVKVSRSYRIQPADEPRLDPLA
ncbi:MAG: hypothetical protein A9Z00_14465 [Thermobacillus sp. ZCTH02-B1]|uniref:hypothetical protein n=1 Tax=Thermobacillus sp. ZCTH02-B1 TaxID=1858795 RepID=UPI000B5769C7|nr:hypothetical protein [Thermobacillus sp. ZCTH02-B1]OUM95162.1 MAG: hypothetical protein A9Z00_14465 [Thermobacillus sp. ZCTH02-B1]